MKHPEGGFFFWNRNPLVHYIFNIINKYGMRNFITCVEMRFHLLKLGESGILEYGLNVFTFIQMEECYERIF